MLNLILAVNDKRIEKFISSQNNINVLTTLKKREEIIDRVIDLNPHAIVISRFLNGSYDFKVLLKKLHNLKPETKIIFLYGSPDNESALFADYLVHTGIYNFIVGSIDEMNLLDSIFKEYTIDDVQNYVLTEDDYELENQEESEKTEVLKEEQIVEPLKNPEPEPELELLIVEKIIEKHIVEIQHIGTYEIAVASLFARAGCTHLTFEIASFLSAEKFNVGVIVDQSVYLKLKDHYQNKNDYSINVNGFTVYTDSYKSMAINKHQILVLDIGKIENNDKLNYNLPILINPLSEWETDRILNYISIKADLLKIIKWVFYPCTDEEFSLMYKDMQTIDCIPYKNEYSLWKAPSKQNQDNYNAIFYDVLTQFKKSTAKPLKKNFFKRKNHVSNLDTR